MESKFILGLDISTKVIGIAVMEDKGEHGKLTLLHHVIPKVKAETKTEELFLKVDVFKEFLLKYKDLGIYKVVIEEPLLNSNNVYTVAILLRFNGMISKVCYDVLAIVPDFISSYDARAFSYPDLMQKRKANKKGEPFTESQLKKKKPVLFGGYPYDIDKKYIMWEIVCGEFPDIVWLYDKKGKLKNENFDMVDALVAVLGQQKKEGIWR